MYRVGEQWRKMANYRPCGAHRSKRGRYLFSSPPLSRGIVDNAIVKNHPQLRSCSASLRLLKCESGINRRLPRVSSARGPPIYSVSHLTSLRSALLEGNCTLHSIARSSHYLPNAKQIVYITAGSKFTGQHVSGTEPLTCLHGIPLVFHKQVDRLSINEANPARCRFVRLHANRFDSSFHEQLIEPRSRKTRVFYRARYSEPARIQRDRTNMSVLLDFCS